MTVRSHCWVVDTSRASGATDCEPLNFGATSEQRRPNTTENQASSGTRRRSQALRVTTLYGLQNLHPRFKSGRRLQFFREKSRGRLSGGDRDRAPLWRVSTFRPVRFATSLARPSSRSTARQWFAPWSGSREPHVPFDLPPVQHLSDLKGGRLLVYFPDADLADGAAEASIGGFFDVNNTPLWDTWVAMFRDAEGDESFADYVVAWVPAFSWNLLQPDSTLTPRARGAGTGRTRSIVVISAPVEDVVDRQQFSHNRSSSLARSEVAAGLPSPAPDRAGGA